MNRPEDRPYFFDSGLRFECARCGACCTGAPGVVRVSAAEIEAITADLGLERKDFVRGYLRKFGGEWCVRERDNGDCLFYRERGCRIHAVRPRQCRTWPFWTDNLRSEAAWAAAGRACPGIGRGRLRSRAEILAVCEGKGRP